MARFIKHVTLAGATVAPGVQLKKTWRVRNDHPAASWPDKVEIVQVGGEAALSADTQSVRGGVVPGGEQDITVFAQAPHSPGYYECHFKLSCVDTSLRFGQRLTLAITVVGPMTSSSSSSSDESDSSSSSSSDSSSSDTDDDVPMSVHPRKARKLKRKIQKLESKHRAKISRISNKLEKLNIAQRAVAADAAVAVALPVADTVPCGNPEAAQQWQAEAEQLSSMGFSNHAWNARLLVKFGGNVERVVQRLLEKRKKQEKKHAKKLHKKLYKCKKKEQKKAKKALS